MPQYFTDKQLNFAQWYLEHKRTLYKSLVGFLIFWIFLFFGIAIYNLVIYVTTSDMQQAMLKEMTVNRINFLALHKIFAPNELAVDERALIYNKGVGYDFIAMIENPNDKWHASSVEYYFSWDGGRTETKQTFVLPRSIKYFFVLRQDIKAKPNNVEIVFSRIKWKRVRPDSRVDFQILSQINISNVKLNYVVPEQKMVSLPKISFKVANQSVYSFWIVDFVIALYDGSRLVGLNSQPIKKFLSNEQRDVELMWPSIPQSTQIRVIPEINIFDPSIFMPSI